MVCIVFGYCEVVAIADGEDGNERGSEHLYTAELQGQRLNLDLDLPDLHTTWRRRLDEVTPWR